MFQCEIKPVSLLVKLRCIQPTCIEKQCQSISSFSITSTHPHISHYETRPQKQPEASLQSVLQAVCFDHMHANPVFFFFGSSSKRLPASCMFTPLVAMAITRCVVVVKFNPCVKKNRIHRNYGEPGELIGKTWMAEGTSQEFVNKLHTQGTCSWSTVALQRHRGGGDI